MYKIKFWRFATRNPGAGPIFVQNSGKLFLLDFPAGLCYKGNNFILLKAVRRTNGVRHSVFRESRRGTGSAWCKRPGRRPHLYHRRVWGRTPAGYGPLQPARVIFQIVESCCIFTRRSIIRVEPWAISAHPVAIVTGWAFSFTPI